MKWWEAPEYDKPVPMNYARSVFKTRRVLDATDPTWVETESGQKVLRLTQAKPSRPKARIFVAPCLRHAAF